jgi:small conductance mechanosensitive channel
MLMAAAECGNDYACQLIDRLGLTGFWRETTQFLLNRPLKILFVVVLAAILARILSRVANKAIRSLAGTAPVRRTSPRGDARARTLAGVTGSVVRLVVWTVAGFTILGILGVNLGPLIAGASLVGVALGFGAQALVRDFLSGFFILVEDQYGVGDRVTVGGSTGTVEDVSLRVTRLRALDGAVWFVPNGEIRKVANATLGWARANIDILLPLDADVDRAVQAMTEEVQSIAADEQWTDTVVEAPQVLGIESMSADGYTVRVTARTKPLTQDGFARALRARLGARLKQEGIALAKPPAVAAQGSTDAPET